MFLLIFGKREKMTPVEADRLHDDDMYNFFYYVEASNDSYVSSSSSSWCEIGSIYGAPADCLWGGGRVGFGDALPAEAAALTDGTRRFTGI